MFFFSNLVFMRFSTFQLPRDVHRPFSSCHVYRRVDFYMNIFKSIAAESRKMAIFASCRLILCCVLYQCFSFGFRQKMYANAIFCSTRASHDFNKPIYSIAAECTKFYSISFLLKRTWKTSYFTKKNPTVFLHSREIATLNKMYYGKRIVGLRSKWTSKMKGWK